jgi:uncharacterized protein (DUF2249 family)
MTKSVRIENADTSDHKVVVQTWQKCNEGEPDVLISEHDLSHPTQMHEGLIHQHQYLVIKEVE